MDGNSLRVWVLGGKAFRGLEGECIHTLSIGYASALIGVFCMIAY